jgi:hypothetical protein
MFDKEFKMAIQNLPVLEKDKLLLRLLKKDLVLANRLYFELVDNETAEEKRLKIEIKISDYLKKSHERFYSMGYLMMSMRDMSGLITEHVSISKDKYGEITLNLQLLIESISLNNAYILDAKAKDSHSFCIYIIARAFKILILIKQQHEDLHIEFKSRLKELGLLIGDNQILMQHAMHNGLDVNWLLGFEIPEDIVFFHKDLRENGYLR